MRFTKIVVCLLLCSMLVTTILPVRAESVLTNGISLSIETDETTYEEDVIAATITVKNQNAFPVYNVSIDGIIPEGYYVQFLGESSTDIEVLAAGEERSIQAEFVLENGRIRIDTSQSVFNTGKLDTSEFPDMLNGFISLHTRSGIVYKNGNKFMLETSPVETDTGYLVVAEEICNILDVSYNIENGNVIINGKEATVIEQNGIYYVEAQYFFETILEKEVAIDVEAKSDGMMIAGDTEFVFPSASRFTETDVSNLRSELQNLNDYLMFERPTSEQITAQYNSSALKGEHPRILATEDDFNELKVEVQTNPQKAEWYQQLLLEANVLVEDNVDPLIYELRDGVRLLHVARDLVDHMYILGMAYQLTGDMKYVNRAWVDLESVCAFETWLANYLDPSEFCAGVVVGYDWMYDAFTEEQRGIIEDAVYNKAFRLACDEYMGKGTLGYRTIASYNHCVIINSAFAMGALAMMDVYPEECAYIVSNALRATDITMTEYGPEGAWPEGATYWAYTSWYSTQLLTTLETIFGTCFTLDKVEGLDTTAEFILNMQSDVGAFNYHDSGTDSVLGPEILYFSNKYDNPDITSTLLTLSNGTVTSPEYAAPSLVMSLLRYDTSIEDNAVSLPLDSIYYDEGLATFRSEWTDEGATFASIHGGETLRNHAQLDAGTFIYDYKGVRWVRDVGSTPYDTSVTGQYNVTGGRWRLYKSKAEAHNTLVIVNSNYNTEGTDQVVDAEANFIEFESKNKGGLTVLDMSESYALGASEVIRGFCLTDDRNSLVVRDEISLLEANSTVYWFLHTDADVTIAADGQSAILSQDGKQVKLEYVVTGTGSATLGYGPSTREMLGSVSPINVAAGSDSNKYDAEAAGVNRIYVKLSEASGDIAITTKLTPIDINGSSISEFNKAIDSWTIPDGDIAAKPVVEKVVIDNREIAFDKGNHGTFFCVSGNYSSVPGATVIVDDTKYDYQVTNATNTNGGVTTVVVSDKENASLSTTYTVEFIEIPEPTEFEGMNSIQVVNVEASDEPQGADNGYYRWKVLDNDTNSRWTSKGPGNWILFELEEATTVDNLMIVFINSSVRKSYFSISVSVDGEIWTLVSNNKSTVTDAEGVYQQYDIGGRTAKYIRLDCNGNSAQGITEGWNNIGEVVFTKNEVAPALYLSSEESASVQSSYDVSLSNIVTYTTEETSDMEVNTVEVTKSITVGENTISIGAIVKYTLSPYMLYIDEDFETCVAGVNFPDGFVTINDTNGNIVISETDNNVHISMIEPAKSAYIQVKPDNMESEEMRSVVFETDIGYDVAGVNLMIYGRGSTSSNTCNFAWISSDGVLKNGSGNLATFAAGEVYNLKISMDMENMTYDLFVDDVQKVEDASLGNLDIFQEMRLNVASASNVANRNMKIDNVKVYGSKISDSSTGGIDTTLYDQDIQKHSTIIIDQNFDALSTGRTMPTYFNRNSDTGAKINIAASGDNKYILMSEPANGADIRVVPSGEAATLVSECSSIIYEMEIGCNTAGVNLLIYGRGSTSSNTHNFAVVTAEGALTSGTENIHTFMPGKMCKLSFVMDFDKMTYDVYVNKEKKITGASLGSYDVFQEMRMKVNSAGTVTGRDLIIDNVKVLGYKPEVQSEYDVAVQAHTVSIIDQNFDALSTGRTMPTYFTRNSDTGAKINIVASGDNKYILMSEPANGADIRVVPSGDAATAVSECTSIVYEMEVGYDTAGVTLLIYGRGSTSSKTYNFGTITSGGTLTNGAEVIHTFEAGQMNKLTIVMDFNAGTYDLYVDEIKKVTGASLGNFDVFQELRFKVNSTGTVANRDLKIDNVKVLGKSAE